MFGGRVSGVEALGAEGEAAEGCEEGCHEGGVDACCEGAGEVSSLESDDVDEREGLEEVGRVLCGAGEVEARGEGEMSNGREGQRDVLIADQGRSWSKV